MRHQLYTAIIPLSMAAAFAVATTPAQADWLVTTDGARVETKGPWKVDGRQVIFTMPNGTLSAMRSSEIDFEASEQVTREAVAVKEAEAAPANVEKKPLPKPVLVLTNKDIPRASLDEESGGPRPEVVPGVAEREPVQVISWKRIDVDEGVELRGTVRNTGRALAANITVRAEVRDEEGEVLGTGNAFLGNSSLVSGRSTSFRIVLPEVDDFAGDPVFSVTSTKLTVGGAAVSRNPQPEDEDAEKPAAASGSADGQASAGTADEDAEPEADPEVEPGEQVDNSAEKP